MVKIKNLRFNFNVKFGIVLGTTSVLKDCPHPCTYNGHKFCEPIPCPPPPPNCTHPFTPPGGCCEICQDGKYRPGIITDAYII